VVPVRGVPQEARHRVAIGSLTNWDAARVFLEVVRCGSFRSAAERLELSINVVRRRIDDFERQVSATLFTHNVHGTRLTDEGSLVVSAVERMVAASFVTRFRAKSGSPSPKVWERFGWPLALSTSRRGSNIRLRALGAK
jgi:molybdenum-dependent DNA-binding transcriptional regulator ModE